jgi:hypothetical protein
MPSDTRTHSSNQEALLLDQALDAVNQRLHSIHQPLAIAHSSQQTRPQQARNSLVHAVGRARERGIDFHTEYQRLSNGALDAMGVQPAVSAAETSRPAAGSAADPPPPQAADARPQAPSPAPSASAPAPASTQTPAPAPVPDSGVETTRLFLEYLEKRERQLFDLMHTVVTRNQPATPAHQPSSQLQVEAQLDRLGMAVADLTKVIDASHPRFPRRVS